MNAGTEKGNPSRARRGDRLIGGATVGVALAVALGGLTFDTTFPADPLGPKVFPLVSAALLMIGGGWVLFRPEPVELEPLPGAVWLGAASFVVYALLLEPIGFFSATLIEFVALSTLFGGSPVRSGLAGALFVGALYILFVVGLGLVLPLGSLFTLGS